LFSSIPRGRRPTFLHLNEDRAGIFGINVRPSTTHLALANLAGRFLSQESMPTPVTPAEFVEQITRRICAQMKEHPHMAYEGIGVSLPGRVDLSSQKFVFAPNLVWHDEELKERLEQATGLTVELENEANACALSEFWFGQHTDGARNLIAVAVSEGIGVGMILNGQLVRGPSGLAGEFGHVTLAENGPKCGCGNQGCWEVFASNSAAVRYYRESKSAVHNGRNHSAKRNGDTTFEDVLEFAEQGDLKALEPLWVRLLYLQPDGVSEALLGALARFAVPYVDIPLQHASGAVLRAMGRGSDGARSLELLSRVRAVLPEVAVRSTFITGFPGERERDVDELLAFVDEAGLAVAGVFVFDPQDGTRAARLPRRVPPQIAEERASRLSAAIGAAAARYWDRYVGREVEVLIERGSRGGGGEAVGRIAQQAPDVDGVTILPGARAQRGSVVKAVVESHAGYDLTARRS